MNSVYLTSKSMFLYSHGEATQDFTSQTSTHWFLNGFLQITESLLSPVHLLSPLVPRPSAFVGLNITRTLAQHTVTVTWDPLL